MRLTNLIKFLSASAVFLVLGQPAFAQSISTSSQGVAKLGAPAMSAPSAVPSPDPGSLFNYAGSVGKTLRFLVVGSTDGSVWGDGVYTSDSVLAAAAVHAGLLEPGESGIVGVELVTGPPTYDGAERHGVVSQPYGAWNVAYRLAGVERIEGAVLPDPESLTAYRGQDGTILKFQIVGSLFGSVWGDGVYTDDSILAAAAVHAGVVAAGEVGVVTVEILPGQAAYGSSVANGIETKAYAEWGGSYRILPPLGGKTKSKLTN